MSKPEADPAAVSPGAPAGEGCTTRRAVPGAATAPLCAGFDVSAPSEMVELCAAWLVIDDEMDRQMARWARLETLAAEGHDYFQLSPAQIRALPMAPEMEAIDDRVRLLGRERQRLLQVLGGMKPNSIHDVAAQLALAARVLHNQDCAAEPLISQAAAYLADHRCPGCGGAYMPGVIGVAREA